MYNLRLVKIGALYCIQPSVGMQELCLGPANIFRGATQEEILNMTRAYPLVTFQEEVRKEVADFIDNGHHRAYVIRFHSAVPSPETQVYVGTNKNPGYDPTLLERIVSAGRKVCNLRFRS
mgnify:CR=1 FL=1